MQYAAGGFKEDKDLAGADDRHIQQASDVFQLEVKTSRLTGTSLL
jgi:hypothetical protein